MKNQITPTASFFGILLFICFTFIPAPFLQAQPEIPKEADFFALNKIELYGITDFTAHKNNETVRLQWRAKTKNTLFFIQRSIDNQNFKTVKVLEKKGETAVPEKILLEIREDHNATGYYYRILKINKDGSYFYTRATPITCGNPLITEHYGRHAQSF